MIQDSGSQLAAACEASYKPEGEICIFVSGACLLYPTILKSAGWVLLSCSLTQPLRSASLTSMGVLLDSQALQAYMKDAMANLNRKVADLDDVRLVMATLKEVRQEPDQDELMPARTTLLRASCAAGLAIWPRI